MAKLNDVLKAALAQKQERNLPNAKNTGEKKVKAQSVADKKPVKKASGRGR